MRGCRNLETKCVDCDRVVNTATLSEKWPWISVKDKLPANDRYVLVVIGDFVDICFYEDGKWLDKEYIDHEVSYWMELPEVPQE